MLHFMNRIGLIAAIVVTGLLLTSCLPISSNTQTQVTVISLDPDIHYQTISGWEATADISDTPNEPEWARYYDTLMDQAVYELGLNRIRLEIRSGAEDNTGTGSKFIAGSINQNDWSKIRYLTVNDNDDPDDINWDGFDFAELDWHIDNTVIPMQKRLASQNEKLFVNLCYVAFRSGWYIHKDPEEYAEFVLATYLHMQDKYGFVPDTWEVILEPDLKPDMWDGKMIGEAIVATSRRLRENGFTPAFVVPSVTNMQNAVPYLKQISTIPGAMDHVVEFSYHRYGRNNKRTLSEIAGLARQYDIRTSMLEWWFGKATYKVLHEDLKLGQVSAWQGRVLPGHFDVQNPDSERPVVRPKAEVRYNLQYFRDVRVGAVRIDAQSSNEKWMDPLAFVNTDGSTTVVIKALRSGQLSIEDLPEGLYQISYAVEQGSEVLPERVAIAPDENLLASIPDAGVLTITSR